MHIPAALCLECCTRVLEYWRLMDIFRWGKKVGTKRVVFAGMMVRWIGCCMFVWWRPRQGYRGWMVLLVNLSLHFFFAFKRKSITLSI